MAVTSDTRWHSWHLYVDSADPVVTEQALVEVVAPALDRLRATGQAPDRWFFVRYWQGGPHIRLRVAGLAERPATDLAEELAAGLAVLNGELPPAQRLDPAAYRTEVAGRAAAGEGGRPLPLEPLRPGGVYAEPYHAELDRYGGGELMPVSERLFHLSSVLAMRLCLARKAGSGTLSTGLQALAATVGALPPGTDPVRFLRGVRANWARWIEIAGPGHSPGPGPGPARLDDEARAAAHRLGPAAPAILALLREPVAPWQPWTAGLAAATPAWLRLGPDRAVRIFGAHLHMLQNRLGVTPAREAYLAAILAHLLEQREAGRYSSG
jgi:thiopeptide-type bacteriocin biosynthesis protein